MSEMEMGEDGKREGNYKIIYRLRECHCVEGRVSRNAFVYYKD